MSETRIDWDRATNKVAPETFWEPARMGDGYDRMEAAGKCGWRPLSGWGLNGWDLLEWPYYVAYARERDGRFEFATNCEGDTDVWSFPTSDERERFVDCLAVWHWQTKGDDWASTARTWQEIPAHLRGAFSWQRLDASKAVPPNG